MASLTGEFGNANASRKPSNVQTAAMDDLAVDPRAVGQIVANATPEQRAELADFTDKWNEHFRVGKHDMPDWILPVLVAALGAPFALQALGVGAAGAGAAGAGAAGTGAAGAAGAGAAGAGAAGAGTALAGGAGALGAAGTVSELVITAAASGMTIPQIAAAVGIPAFAVSNVLQNAAGSNVMQGGDAGDTLSQPGDGTTVDELVITADKLNPATWTDLVPVGALDSAMIAKGISNGLGAELKPVDKVDPKQIAEGVEKGVDYTVPTAGELLSGPGPSVVDKALEWAKAHPDLVAKGIAPLIGAGAAAGGDSKTGGGIPPGFATAGTPGSLSDKFRAQLPAPSGPFGNLAGRDVSMTPEEWKTYGARPEQSFFANVPIRPSGIIDTSKRAPVNPGLNPAEAEPGFKAKVTPDVQVAPGYWPEPNSPVPGFNPTAPSSVNSTSGSDMNRGSMTAEQFAVAMKRMEDARQAQPLPAPSKGFKVGGFAVSGPGTGRSDDIPARLSDGEYVIDAETVALLGDGSSQAGSKRLDEFRANIRKHKGRQLSKGKFSHNARKPEAYLHGGQV